MKEPTGIEQMERVLVAEMVQQLIVILVPMV